MIRKLRKFNSTGKTLDAIFKVAERPNPKELREAIAFAFFGLDLIIGDDGDDWQCDPRSMFFPAIFAGIRAAHTSTAIDAAESVLEEAGEKIAGHIVRQIFGGELIEKSVEEAFHSFFADERCSWPLSAAVGIKAFWAAIGPLPEL